MVPECVTAMSALWLHQKKVSEEVQASDLRDHDSLSIPLIYYVPGIVCVCLLTQVGFMTGRTSTDWTVQGRCHKVGGIDVDSTVSPPNLFIQLLAG